jgi:hypothetical protein
MPGGCVFISIIKKNDFLCKKNYKKIDFLFLEKTDVIVYLFFGLGLKFISFSCGKKMTKELYIDYSSNALTISLYDVLF